MPPLKDLKQKEIDKLRQKAKKVKRKRDISHKEALDVVAQAEGYTDWAHLQSHNNVATYRRGICVE